MLIFHQRSTIFLLLLPLWKILFDRRPDAGHSSWLLIVKARTCGTGPPEPFTRRIVCTRKHHRRGSSWCCTQLKRTHNLMMHLFPTGKRQFRLLHPFALNKCPSAIIACFFAKRICRRAVAGKLADGMKQSHLSPLLEFMNGRQTQSVAERLLSERLLRIPSMI